MGLREYRRKRDFKATPEPSGRSRRGARRARPAGRAFVVQKHAASHLHYDFRLELDGTLKSWAVPKGPSLDPADKRLAMQVEDHPIEYGGFEGTIPKGEYGGGTVLLWDRGTWEPAGDPQKSYRDGNLKFALRGRKLRGSWALVRMHGRQRGAGKRSWLLIKERDAEARTGASARVVETRPKSVSTGRTLERIAKPKDRPREPGPTRKARASSLPRFIQPQLATLVDAAPTGDAWLHEMKYDGYRILARIARGKVTLESRNGNDWTEKFPAIVHAATRLPLDQAMLDGEVAVLLPDGTTSFQALQNALSGTHAGRLVYMVFDLLHLDGSDLTGARLENRKAELAALFRKAGKAAEPLRYSDHVVGGGPQVFAKACRLGLEGIVSKRRDAVYRGTRSRDWLKVKCSKRQEIVIGGYTEPAGTRVGLGALLGGVHEGGRLVYAGKIGTGFSDRTLRDLKASLAARERSSCPFAERPSGVGRAHWVKPDLVAEVSFSEWTDDGRMRHPAFLGLRKDKAAASVVRERPRPVAAVARRTGPSRSPTRRPRVRVHARA